MTDVRCTERGVVEAPVEEVARKVVKSDPTVGLSSEEAARRRQEYGPNELEQDEPEHPCVKFASQLKEPLILLLFASAIISTCLGQYDDAISIALAVLIVSFVAFVQEMRSEESLKALASLVPHKATVIRDGQPPTTVLARDLVPGDAVDVAAGARVPADCRVVDSVELVVDESSLSGESEPVAKTHRGPPANGSSSPEASQLAVADCKTTIFMGTYVRSGRCRALVVCTGSRTEFGRAAAEMKELEAQRSPLQQGMDELGKRLSFASICVIVAICVVGLLRGERLLDMFTIGVSLAVAAIPEGLPICVAVTLALGVMRMALRHAVVKRLPAVEALGCTDVLCVDKTGTLTVNEMTLAEVWCPPLARSGADGDGTRRELVLRRAASPAPDESSPRWGDASGRYVVVVDRREFSADVLPPQVCRVLDAATVCSNATLATNGEPEAGVGLPTEVAILAAARDLAVPDRRPALRRVHETPFTSDRKRMDVTVVDDAASRVTYVKGAFEALRPDIAYTYANDAIAPLTRDVEAAILEASQELSARGLRVVTVAASSRPPEPPKRAVPRRPRSFFSTATSADDYDDDDLNALSLRPDAAAPREDPNDPTKLVFLGLLALSDPARPSALAAVGALKDRGVRIVMLTGDGRETARAIGRDVGILSPIRGLDASGEDIDRWVAQGDLGSQLSRGVAVLYRVSPRHKLEVVRALQRQGSVVAMTGDGVNDAPALRAADVGVAMGGGRGTDVAVEAADVVLTDDDVFSIVAAVDEGKGIFHNIRNFITFQLSTSFAALGLVAVAHLLDLPTPLNAMQVLWINIIMDGPPAQAYSFEPASADVVRCPPRPRSEPIVTQAIFVRVVTSALLICAGTLAVFASEHVPDARAGGSASPRTSTMTFTTFVCFDMFNALACRSDSAIVGTRRLSLTSNRPFCLAVGGSLLGQLAVIYWAPLRAVFQTEPLTLRDLLKIACIASTVLVLDVARKLHVFGFRGSTLAALSPRQTTKGNHNPRWRRWYRLLQRPSGKAQSNGAQEHIV